MLGAHQILACMNIRQQHNCIMTDCQAAQKAVNGNNTHWTGKEQDQLVHAIRRINDSHIGWAESHPERRHKNNLARYSQNDYGIAIADETCRGTTELWRDKSIAAAIRNNTVHHYTITMKEVLLQLLQDCDFAWTRNGVPITQTIINIKNERRIHEYTNQRKGFLGAELSYTAKVSPAVGFIERGKRTKRIFDWQYDRRNAAKGIKDKEKRAKATECLLCGEPDSQSHAICDCLHCDLIEARDGISQDVDTLIQNLPLQTVDTAKIIKNMCEKHIRSGKLQLGIWPKLARKELTRKLNYENLPTEEKKDAKNALWKINQIYHEGARNLLRIKRNIETDLTPSPTPSVPLTAIPRGGRARSHKLRITTRPRKLAMKKYAPTQGRLRQKTIYQYLSDMQCISTSSMTHDTEFQ